MLPDITTLIPHRRPILLLDAMTRADDTGMEARFTITPDNIFVREDGTLEPVACLEALAQCFAGGCGVTRPSKWGYLAAVRHFRVLDSARVGDTLTACVAPTAQVDAIVVVEGVLQRGQTVIAEAQFKIYTPEEAER